MQKSVFPKAHKHEVEKEDLRKYQKNLKRKGKRFKAHAPIETFDSRQVLKLLSKKSVVRLGVVQGADTKGQRVSMLVAYNSRGKMVGKALQTADPCPPPPCEVE